MKRRETKQGLVVLVGSGPGDPGLITAAGIKWLNQAEVIVYDRLVNPALLDLAPETAERVYVGKTPGSDSITQEEINELLVAKARAGKLVIRLKGGDPLIFGRGGEEAEALRRAGVPFRIFPGITAGMAAAAYAGIPLTDRRIASTVAFVTGHEDPDKGSSAVDWKALSGVDTLVFYMGVGTLPRITEELMGSGREAGTPVAVVEQVATAKQRTIVGTLETIADQAATAGIRPPAVVIVGDVVKMRDRLAWVEDLPLFGRTVLVTRPRKQAVKLSARLVELGAEVIEAPTVIVEPPDSFEPIDDALRRLGEFDWMVFTSSNAVRGLFGRMEDIHLDARALGGVRVAVVGPGTADALRECSLRADLIPEKFTTEGLAAALQATVELEGKRVLLPRTDIATAALPQALRDSGAIVEEVIAYRTVCPVDLPAQAVAALQTGEVDWITFTSSSTVENFAVLVDVAQVNLSEIKLGAIGPVTAETLRAHGLKPTVVADPHTIDALVSAIVAHERRSTQGR